MKVGWELLIAYCVGLIMGALVAEPKFPIWPICIFSFCVGLFSSYFGSKLKPEAK